MYRNNKLFDIVQPINRAGPLLCKALAKCYFIPMPQERLNCYAGLHIVENVM